MNYFVDLKQNNGLDDFDHYFAFVVINEIKIKRIVIDYRDKNTLNFTALQWSDSYGKVNFNSEVEDYKLLLKEEKTKILPVGPNFGIKIWGLIESGWLLFFNYISCYKQLPIGFRSFMEGYNWQIKRDSLKHYESAISDNNYIFFISSLYINEANGSNTNSLRAAYVRACKNANCIFEGGLLAKAQSNPNFKSYKDVITHVYVKPKEYIEKIKRSAIVFNTPAVWGCHGWKLGEYLALGKAIISTPFLNEMPEPMQHGLNIHFIKHESELNEAVELLLFDKYYRKKLENGAKEYYKKWIEPTALVQKLIMIE